MFAVKAFVARIFLAESLSLVSRWEQAIEITGGSAATCQLDSVLSTEQIKKIIYLVKPTAEQRESKSVFLNNNKCIRPRTYLKHPRFPIPSSETVDTKAIGRGMMPLIMTS